MEMSEKVHHCEHLLQYASLVLVLLHQLEWNGMEMYSKMFCSRTAGKKIKASAEILQTLILVIILVHFFT